MKCRIVLNKKRITLIAESKPEEKMFYHIRNNRLDLKFSGFSREIIGGKTTKLELTFRIEEAISKHAKEAAK